jgi:chromosome partitioning protein
MGFLSRRNKSAKSASAAVEVEETHPIVEELEAMEEAVPERRDDEGSARRPAGPVGAGDPPPPAVAEASSGEVPPTSPPAGEAQEEVAPAPTGLEAERDGASEETAPAISVEAERDGAPEEDSGPERFMPRDLIAPSRHETVVEEPASETPVKHAEVIAFANQKGGVAKTTTTLNLAVAFAESGHRVLCIDLDPQGNLTMSQGIDPDKVEKSLYDVLVNDMPISEIIQHREIDIAVSSIDLAGAEIAMSTKIGRERSLEKALKEVIADYDFVCIDTPPSLGLLTINALTAANKVIVPVQCEYLSMRGLVQLQNTLKMIQENLNPDVRIEGILPTMLDSRTVHAKEAVEILEENFGDLVFRSRIRKAIKFAEAPVKGASVLKYDPQSNAAGYYRDLAKEVLANESA